MLGKLADCLIELTYILLTVLFIVTGFGHLGHLGKLCHLGFLGHAGYLYRSGTKKRDCHAVFLIVLTMRPPSKQECGEDYFYWSTTVDRLDRGGDSEFEWCFM